MIDSKLSIWNPEDNEENMRLLDIIIPDRIILYAQYEFEYTAFECFEPLVNYSIKYNIPLYVIICTDSHERLLHDINNARYKNVIIVRWGTYWFTQTMLSLQYVKSPKFEQPEIYTYPFISMNCKARPHRGMLMNSLAKFNLIDIGAVSWLEYTGPEQINYWEKGPYEYWIPKIIKLTEDAHGDLNQYSVPAEYNKSFVQVVPETVTNAFVLSEKHACLYFKRNRLLF